MKIITDGSLTELLKVADTGPFLHAEIISLTGKGKLRVTCDWLYSSLNCDPNDDSTFLWEFAKIDEKHISLSPVIECRDRQIYASVRDDINWYVQVQAPYSADWITAVGRNETIRFTMHDLSTAEFHGFNGSRIAVNSNEDNHGGHRGYRVRSVDSSDEKAAQWFIGIQSCRQSDIQFSGYSSRLELLEN